MRDLTALPKAHLHLHLVGSARPATIAEFARRQGLLSSDLSDFTDLPSFMNRYRQLEAAISGIEDLQRICREVVEDAARDGVVHIEPILPNPWDYPGWDVTPADFFAALDGALRSAGAQYGVSVSYIVGVDRAMSPVTMEKVAHWAVAHKGGGVTAFAYGGDERLGSLRLAGACSIARAGGLDVIPHAGESMGPESVREALQVTNAHRVSHGIRATEDARLLRYLARHDICCDVCPTSNLRLHVYESARAIPIPALLAARVPISLNADDSLFFGSSILREYEGVRQTLGLSDDQIARIARDSVRHSSASLDVKHAAYAGIDRWLASPDVPAPLPNNRQPGLATP